MPPRPRTRLLRPRRSCLTAGWTSGLLLLLLAAAPALAQELPAPSALPDGACRQVFADGRRPEIVDPKRAATTRFLCFQSFAVLHSGLSRTPLYAAEHLTAQALASARSLDRIEAFHEEDGLPPAERAALYDYVGSGYDRGHMAPAGDMPDGPSQARSFSLANIVPQDRDSNRHLWSEIEAAVRGLAYRRGEIFVLTGPIYSGASVQALRGRVLVPTRLFKAVYDPRAREGAAYVADNASDRAWRAVSLAELREIAGIDAFPGASLERAMRLPEPRPRPGRERSDETWLGWLGRQMMHLLRLVWHVLARSAFA